MMLVSAVCILESGRPCALWRMGRMLLACRLPVVWSSAGYALQSTATFAGIAG